MGTANNGADIGVKTMEIHTKARAVMVDGCPHTFQQLASKVLPARVRDLQRAACYPMGIFATIGRGPTAILQQIGRRQDFPGCYVLWDGNEPFYTGISRKVAGRLMQHVRGRTHFDASLAYRIARNGQRQGLRRAQAMTDSAFNARFQAAKKQIAGMSVRFIQIDNPLERYLFEVYASMELGTHRFNTFETH
jgi:hypothetical protein